jgi:hypothetical protein
VVEEPRIDTLLGVLMKRSRLPWYWATAAVATVLLLSLILTAFLDDNLHDLSELSFWRIQLSAFALITYVLAIYPFMWRVRDRAVQAFRPVLPIEEDDFDQLAAEVSAPNRRWEWAAVLMGALVPVALIQAANLDWDAEPWLSVYAVVTTLLFWGLMGWLIYDTLAGIRSIYRLSRRDLKLDIFDTELLVPIAQWSLGISLAFVGGISLSLVFQTQDSLTSWDSITIYAFLIGVTVLMFFLSMWSAHTAMAEAKKRELALTRSHLVAASRELKERGAEGRMEGMEGLSSAISSWATYQRLVQEVPVWPFNAVIIRRLVASIVAPVAILLIKVLPRIGIN